VTVQEEISQTALVVLKAECSAKEILPEFPCYTNSSHQMADALGYDLSKIRVSVDDVVSIAIRKKMIMNQIRRFVSNYPQSVVVNLGCGLSSFYKEFEKTDVVWFDLDLPELICLRRNFFSESAKYRLVSQSVLDFSWMDQIPTDRPALFIMEGLLPYFQEGEVRGLLEELMRRFPKQELIVHAISKWRTSRPHSELKKGGIHLHWGVASAQAITRWIPNLRLIEEGYPYSASASKWSLKMRILRLFPAIRCMDKIFRYASQ
jgi:O-methyltransferase involved in polyketide biosynthesis